MSFNFKIATVTRLTALILVVCVFGVSLSQAAPNGGVFFYGSLEDSSGNDVSGTYDMVFSFYDAPVGGTAFAVSIFSVETQNPVDVLNGDFTVVFNSDIKDTINAISESSANVYLGLTVEQGSELLPRHHLTPGQFFSESPKLIIQGAPDAIDVKIESSDEIGDEDNEQFNSQVRKDLVDEQALREDNRRIKLPKEMEKKRRELVKNNLLLKEELILSKFSPGGIVGKEEYVVNESQSGQKDVITLGLEMPNDLDVTTPIANTVQEDGLDNKIKPYRYVFVMGATDNQFSPLNSAIYVNQGGVIVDNIVTDPVEDHSPQESFIEETVLIGEASTTGLIYEEEVTDSENIFQ